ncbi:MAG: GspE/PulE family protein, partial [Thermoanaerobaculia bacterium]
MTIDLPQEPAEKVEALLSWAAREKATDLHFSPFADGCTVRARIDGLLREVCRIEPEAALRVLSRVKVLAEMDIAEKRRPQDGRLSRLLDGQTIDFRASSIPSLHGESLVLRVLDRSAGLRPIDQLGLADRDLRLFQSFLQQASGMTIVSGPTGAGKTTTLYAGLQLLASPERHVLTIEDPIEYEFPRVLQTAVK